MPTKAKKGGSAQMYNTQGLIMPGGYTHTIAQQTIPSPIFAGMKTGGATKKKAKPKPKN